MNKSFFVRVLICIVTLGVLLYGYIAKQNSITQLRLTIPRLAQELETIRQKNCSLHFEIDSRESPNKLLELAKEPRFRHLKWPREDNIARQELINTP